MKIKEPNDCFLFNTVLQVLHRLVPNLYYCVTCIINILGFVLVLALVLAVLLKIFKSLLYANYSPLILIFFNLQ